MEHHQRGQKHILGIRLSSRDIRLSNLDIRLNNNLDIRLSSRGIKPILLDQVIRLTDIKPT